MKTVKFLNKECVVEYGKYNNGRTAIQLYIKKTHEPMATATVNLPGVYLEDNEVAIKDYSENRGMVDALFRANIISLPIKHVPSGMVNIPICSLLILED